MGKKNKRQCQIRKEIEDYVAKNKHSEGASQQRSEVPPWLPHGSLAPRSRTKRSWKELCILLWEKLKQGEDVTEQISVEQAPRIIQLDTSENVLIGDHNSLQVVNNFDPDFHKELYENYEHKLKEDALQRKSIEHQLHILSSSLKELTDTYRRSEQCLHRLANPELACPASSIAKLYQQVTELVNNFSEFTPELIRLQNNVITLRRCIEDSSTSKSQSTISSNEKQPIRSGGIYKCHSEPDIKCTFKESRQVDFPDN